MKKTLKKLVLGILFITGLGITYNYNYQSFEIIFSKANAVDDDDWDNNARIRNSGECKKAYLFKNCYIDSGTPDESDGL